MAGTRGLHVRAGPRAAADRYGVLLHDHLLGDLACYAAPVSHDIATRVSLERIFFPPNLLF